jgi:CubicO group peptidase (beta-lactamase class C family)
MTHSERRSKEEHHVLYLTNCTKTTFTERNTRMNIRTLKRFLPLVMLALLALAMLLPAVSAGATPTTNTPTNFAAIDAYIEQQMRELRIPGLALGIVQNDQIVHLKGFGIAGPDGRGVTPQTPFQLASLVKPMTGVAIMQLAEAGKLDLDAPVQRYLPWFRVADETASAQITVRHLLYHTSGLPGTLGLEYALSGDARPDALEMRARALRTVPLNRPVGQTYEYSNTGYQLLGLIVQEVSGQSYEGYMREHLFTPLQMQQTFTDWTEARSHNAAAGYRYWFGMPLPGEIAIDRAGLPSGGLTASVEDVAHFLVPQLNGGRFGDTAILSADGIAEMQRPIAHIPSSDEFYAMDWGIQPIGGVPAVSKGGDMGDFKTMMILIPERQLGLVVLMNTNKRFDSYLGDVRLPLIPVGVAELLLGQPATVFPASSTPTLLYAVLLTIVAVQVAGMARTVILLRRWRGRPEQHLHGWAAVVVRIGLPLLCNLGWGLFALLGVPALFGVPLSFIRYMAPDFGATLLVSGVIALGWGMMRTIVLLWMHGTVKRRPDVATRVLIKA